MDIPAALAAQSAVTRQNIGLAVVKQAAQSEQAVANIIQEAVENSPVASSNGRGSNIDILV